MRLYTICTLVTILVVVQASHKPDKGKRRAQNYGSRTSTYSGSTSAPQYSSPPAPVYATNAKVNYVPQPQSPSYEQQISVQQPVRLAYAQPVQSQKLASVYTAPQQQFSYSFEAQPELRLAQAQAQPIRYSPMQLQGLLKVAGQPEVQYVAQPQHQQEYRYAYSQPATASVNKVLHPSQTVYKHQSQVQQVRQQYSPASSVSSFSFSSPHVSYNNHGVLSQVISSANAQEQPQTQTKYRTVAYPRAQPVQYVAAQEQYSAPQQVVYVQAAQKPGIQYAHAQQ